MRPDKSSSAERAARAVAMWNRGDITKREISRIVCMRIQSVTRAIYAAWENGQTKRDPRPRILVGRGQCAWCGVVAPIVPVDGQRVCTTCAAGRAPVARGGH